MVQRDLNLLKLQKSSKHSGNQEVTFLIFSNNTIVWAELLRGHVEIALTKFLVCFRPTVNVKNSVLMPFSMNI